MASLSDRTRVTERRKSLTHRHTHSRTHAQNNNVRTDGSGSDSSKHEAEMTENTLHITQRLESRAISTNTYLNNCSFSVWCYQLKPSPSNHNTRKPWTVCRRWGSDQLNNIDHVSWKNNKIHHCEFYNPGKIS